MRNIICSLLLSLSSATISSAAAITGTISIKDSDGKPTGDCTNAVVFLNSVPGASAAPAQSKPEVLLEDRKFKPSVAVVVKGQEIDFPNKDSILHNVFSLSKTKKFDLGLYKQGTSKKVTFDKSGLVKVFCNIHADMVGHVLVLDNAHFGKGKKDCTFSIPAPTDGEYDISAWYTLGKGSSQKVTVKGGKATAPVTMAIVQKRKKFKKHKNKFGKTYKKAY